MREIRIFLGLVWPLEFAISRIQRCVRGLFLILKEF